MSKSSQQILMDRRDGLLREADYLTKRLEKVNRQVTELNTQIQPYIQPKQGLIGFGRKAVEAATHKKLKPGDPGFEWPACEQCGSCSFRCGCD